MKIYEELNIELVALDSTDVITTSKEVTTEDIEVPWGSGVSTNSASFEL